MMKKEEKAVLITMVMLMYTIIIIAITMLVMTA